MTVKFDVLALNVIDFGLEVKEVVRTVTLHNLARYVPKVKQFVLQTAQIINVVVYWLHLRAVGGDHILDHVGCPVELLFDIKSILDFKDQGLGPGADNRLSNL